MFTTSVGRISKRVLKKLCLPPIQEGHSCNDASSKDVQIQFLDPIPLICIRRRYLSVDGPRRANTEGPRRANAEGPRRANAEGPRRANAEGPRRANAEGPLIQENACTLVIDYPGLGRHQSYIYNENGFGVPEIIAAVHKTIVRIYNPNNIKASCIHCSQDTNIHIHLRCGHYMHASCRDTCIATTGSCACGEPLSTRRYWPDFRRLAVSEIEYVADTNEMYVRLI